MPEGLLGIADSPHLQFPQLYIAGVVQDSRWLDLADTELREQFAAAGVQLREPQKAEPCHGSSAFSDGLEAWEVALVELVSQDGAGNWEAKAATLSARDTSTSSGPSDAAGLQAAWERLAPIVKEKLEKQPEMPCGHSCSTCPTRHDCQLHDAVGAPLRDLEDLA